MVWIDVDSLGGVGVSSPGEQLRVATGEQLDVDGVGGGVDAHTGCDVNAVAVGMEEDEVVEVREEEEKEEREEVGGVSRLGGGISSIGLETRGYKI